MSTDLDGALADPSYQIYFDGVTTAARANIATHGDAEGAMESRSGEAGHFYTDWQRLPESASGLMFPTSRHKRRHARPVAR